MFCKLKHIFDANLKYKLSIQSILDGYVYNCLIRLNDKFYLKCWDNISFSLYKYVKEELNFVIKIFCWNQN